MGIRHRAPPVRPEGQSDATGDGTVTLHYHWTMDLRSPGAHVGTDVGAQLNAEVAWDAFDPAAYIDHNYRLLRMDDEQILKIVRDHFSDHFKGQPERPARGIDVGAGANLYPALSMLPWCGEITLFERSAANADYLLGQRISYDQHWDQFWDVLCEDDSYRSVKSPRERFKDIVGVEEGDLFDLGHARHRGRWSMGTMFFVAESMSTSHTEFAAGVERFMGALEPGAPFAAAFMEGSLGYKVGNHFFPACSVTETEVHHSLRPFARGEIAITPIGMPGEALRPGYEGMIVACGIRGSE